MQLASMVQTSTLLCQGIGMALILSGCGQMPQCNGPIQKDLKYGCADHIPLAEQICCHNTEYAESSGFFESVGLFSKLDSAGTTTFYDSVCGAPLFRAPVGRSFEEWQLESQQHGWPSFREAEIFKEYVVIKSGGEMRSVCGTHLGHNIPDGSGDRYCIDLVCIAGQKNKTRPPMVDSTAVSQ
jgi:peptide methionine sulfoxide reductase MsrB